MYYALHHTVYYPEVEVWVEPRASIAAVQFLVRMKTLVNH